MAWRATTSPSWAWPRPSSLVVRTNQLGLAPPLITGGTHQSDGPGPPPLVVRTNQTPPWGGRGQQQLTATLLFLQSTAVDFSI